MSIDTAEALHAKELAEVESEIERLNSRRPVALPLPGRLEFQYQREIGPERRRQLTLRGFVALLIYDLFLVGDYLMFPDHLLRALVVRLGIITPLVFLVTWLLQRPFSPVVRETGATFLCVAGCCSILFLHSNADLTTTVQEEPGMLLILLTMNVILRVDLVYAAIGTVLCYAAELFFLHQDLLLSTSQRFTIGGRIFWIAVLTLFTNYVLTKEHRIGWLRGLHSRIQRRMLALANAELLNLSSTDRLTGLFNRHAYENRLAELWQSSIAAKTPLSVIMVDVDHFKTINDSFGHGYGDRVLQRVATLLQQALRLEDDFVARFGGEEFILLLPKADEASANSVAERLRTLVQVAGSPAVGRGDVMPVADPRWSTVSCGVATCIPAPGDDALTLIEAADAALYTAKQTGRNRVCAAPHVRHAPSRLSVVSRSR